MRKMIVVSVVALASLLVTACSSNSNGVVKIDGDDNCPSDPNKTEPGECGCGVKEGACTNSTEISDTEAPDTGTTDTETPDTGTADTETSGEIDSCPNDPNKTEAGECGCGVEEGTCTPPDSARWTFLVFMNGDNNLESLVTHDLNELEQVGSGDGIHVVVQADRTDGYSTDDGDWTNTRRYYITMDKDTKKVTSTVVEDLGELDMGDPKVLSDFLMWAHENYPARHMALSLWNHGDSWRSTSRLPIARSISDDDTSGNSISIANGELNEALESIVAARGPLEMIGFDACLMASWEVAHSLEGYALNMAGSEAVMFDEGFMYADALTLLKNSESADGAALADRMALDTVQKGNESTHSAIDITALGDLTEAVNDLAEMVLANPSLKDPLLDARDQSRGADSDYNNWYLDLNDLGAALIGSQNDQLQASGWAIQDGIETAVIGAYGNKPYEWTGGLTIMFDFEYSPSYLKQYASGTWSKATVWDDLLDWLSTN